MRAGAFIQGCRDARCVAGGHAAPSSATATTAGLVGYRILLLDAADAANQSLTHISRVERRLIQLTEGPPQEHTQVERPAGSSYERHESGRAQHGASHTFPFGMLLKGAILADER